jgi:arylsulfatase A-like enzyme
MYEMDAIFGYLINKLRANGVLDKMNIIVVSDHGMTALTDEEYVFLKDYPGVLDLINVNKSTFGEVSNINPKSNDKVHKKQKTNKTSKNIPNQMLQFLILIKF